MASRKKEETEKALRLCHRRCVLCGWDSNAITGTTLVVGAHLKPVTELEEDNFTDIIALCPNHHAEFDAYLFSIDPKTRKIIHTERDSPYNGQQLDISYVRAEYLAFRHYLFQKAQEANRLSTV